MIIGTVKEQNEIRTSITPETADKLTKQGYKVVVEAGVGQSSGFSDNAYAEVNAEVTANNLNIATNVDILTVFSGAISKGALTKLKNDSLIIGNLNTRTNSEIVTFAKTKNITLVDLTLLPRTISKGQSMDTLTSQSNLAGYKAAVIAANEYGNYFPMMTTAAGMFKPAKVIVIGTGVAGLQALATCKRLGALTTGYDIRQASENEVKSVGAEFIAPKITIDSKDGYARKLTAEETKSQLAELGEIVKNFDIIITTAAIPGKKPPLMITTKTLEQLPAKTVIVDMGASDLGGNVEGSVPNKIAKLKNGVKIIGAHNLPMAVPAAASAAYSNNILAAIKYLTKKNPENNELEFNFDFEDELTKAIVIKGGK